MSAWDNVENNETYKGTSMDPPPLKVLLVELPNIIQTNIGKNEMVNDTNNMVTIKWNSFNFSSDISWNFQTSDVYWTISRFNISTGESKVVLTDKILNSNGVDYEFRDTDIRVYEKLIYTVTGIFKWKPTNTGILTLKIPGFTTAECFVCKNNRFPYGRFNTTATNLKLYRPLLINTPTGQVDQFGNKTCGGGCIAINQPGLNLYNQGSRISSSNNIYSNTTNQLSKKQTYVLLSKSRFRPDR
jgi:hypothetical protein